MRDWKAFHYLNIWRFCNELRAFLRIFMSFLIKLRNQKLLINCSLFNVSSIKRLKSKHYNFLRCSKRQQHSKHNKSLCSYHNVSNNTFEKNYRSWLNFVIVLSIKNVDIAICDLCSLSSHEELSIYSFRFSSVLRIMFSEPWSNVNAIFDFPRANIEPDFLTVFTFHVVPFPSLC